MMHVGDILSTARDVQYRGGRGILSTVEGYLEYREGYSVPWGDIMMHVAGVQYCGEKIFCYLSIATVLNTPPVLMISPHVS